MVPNRLLKQARELKGWSQARVARELGTDATTVGRWERGQFTPTPYFRERLCLLFHKNAEELGLLEVVDGLSGCTSSLQWMSSSSVAGHEENWRCEEWESDLNLELLPPCWDEHTDTFTYILRSAAYDRQAHMLWKAAYVSALMGHNAEARRLGEASLRAFRYLLGYPQMDQGAVMACGGGSSRKMPGYSEGHVNVRAVREWLNQQVFVAVPSSASELSEHLLVEESELSESELN